MPGIVSDTESAGASVLPDDLSCGPGRTPLRRSGPEIGTVTRSTSRRGCSSFEVRGRRQLVIVGQAKALAIAVKNVRTSRRLTNLPTRLAASGP